MNKNFIYNLRRVYVEIIDSDYVIAKYEVNSYV